MQGVPGEIVLPPLPELQVNLSTSANVVEARKPLFVTGKLTFRGFGLPALIQVHLAGPTYDAKDQVQDIFSTPFTGDFATVLLVERDGIYEVYARAFPPPPLPAGILPPGPVLGESMRLPLAVGKMTPEGFVEMTLPDGTVVVVAPPAVVVPAAPVVPGLPGLPGVPGAPGAAGVGGAGGAAAAFPIPLPVLLPILPEKAITVVKDRLLTDVYNEIGSWTVAPGKLGYLAEVSLTSTNLANTMWRYRIGTDDQILDKVLPANLDLKYPDVKLAAGTVVKVEAKRTAAVIATAWVSITGAEVG